MNGRSISVLKGITREQLLGNYSKLSSYVVLYMLVRFTLMTLIQQIKMYSLVIELLSGLLFSVLMGIFTVGFIRVCILVIHDKQVTVKDFFYVINHDPDKVVIIAAIDWFFSELPYIPLIMSDRLGDSAGVTPGKLALISYLLFAVFFIIYFIAYIMLSQCYYLYLDMPESGALEIVNTSIAVMQKNKLRYLYLTFNILGMLVLGVLTMGIGMIWIMPYTHVLMINFYEDLRLLEKR
ncbi:MAG: DUF975 family protein [Lachnospiraceae bacterium]|nr:DUF975 family protein [Lachnospiraceae bacterium]